jgi:predicted RNase H-like nuclease (RuvC/YqgF family)
MSYDTHSPDSHAPAYRNTVPGRTPAPTYDPIIMGDIQEVPQKSAFAVSPTHQEFQAASFGGLVDQVMTEKDKKIAHFEALVKNLDEKILKLQLTVRLGEARLAEAKAQLRAEEAQNTAQYHRDRANRLERDLAQLS